MRECSIVVVSWNAKDHVRNCLTSLEGQAIDVPMEVIVVDNDSTDGTAEMVRRDFPRATLIQNDSNMGFAKANNIGIKASSGRYVCLINSDVNVFTDCLQQLYGFMESNPTVGVVAPRMLGPDGRVGRSYMRFPTIWNCLCTALCLDKTHRPPFGGVLMTDFSTEVTSDVEVLNGWFLMVRRSALEEVGPLDERFFMYGEDIDWSYRFHLADWRLVYFSDASSIHYGGASSGRAPTRFFIEKHKANIQYWEKHHSPVGVLGYWFTTLLHQSLRMTGHLLAYIFAKQTPSDLSFKIKRSGACIAWLIGLRRIER